MARSSKATVKAYNKKYYAEHKDEQAAWRKAHPKDRQETNRKYWLKATYNMTVEQYDERIATQNNRCAICLVDFADSPGKGNSPVIDHDHTSRIVREILCAKCNQAIGLAGEDRLKLLAMIAYIDKWRYRYHWPT